MRKDQLAINSVSTGGTDLDERLDAYVGAGFRNVEFQLGQVWAEIEKGRSAEDIRRGLDDRGLRCIGGFETELAVFGPKEENHARILRNAELLQALGGTLLVVGTDGGSVRPADPLGEVAGVAGEIAERMTPTGVRLAIEFNWSPWVKSLRSAVEVARRSESSRVGVLFDPAHYHCTPSKFDQLDEEAARYLFHVHVDDMRDKPGELSDCNADRELPGDGILPLGELFGRIESLGYTGCFSIEMFSDHLWSLPAAEAAKLMYDSLLPLCV
ncbi:sugar phosphate isomerase/epimerase [bacterium]|nr:MAG: sugar phosphate isomerase/epimerase [bacterium]